MVKTMQNLNSKNLKNLASEFSLGMTEKLKTTTKNQPLEGENIELYLPPLLVEAFQSGLEEEFKECNCDSGEGHDCTHHTPDADHHACGGCHNHE